MKTRLLPLLLLTILLTAYSSFGQLEKAQELQITKLIQDKITSGAPALAVGIVKNGEVVLEQYLGLANLEHQVKASEKTRFNIASNAKQFTALCLLKLAQEGKVNLEADFRTYLPDYFPNLKDSILAKQLINHSSGIRDYYDLLSIQGNVWWKNVGLDNKDALELIKTQETLNFKPGSDYMYSNSNYTIITDLVSKVSGQSFLEYSQNIFQELGMLQTVFSDNYMGVIPNKALPYSDWGDGKWQQYPMVVDVYGDGFLYTTLKDQLVWEQAVQVRLEERKLIWESQQPISNAKIQSYGFGVEFGKYNGYEVVQHAGGTGSYGAKFIRFGSEKLSIVVMSNNGNVWAEGLTQEIADILLPNKSGESLICELPKYLGKQQPMETFTGVYEKPKGGFVKIFTNEHKLFWQTDNNNPRELIHDEGNLYHMDIDDRLRLLFKSSESEQNTFLTYYLDSVPKTYIKQEVFKPSNEYLEAFAGTYYNAEIDTRFKIAYQEGELSLKQERKNRTTKVQIVYQDNFLAQDYKLKAIKDSFGYVTGLSLDYSRVQNVFFQKEGKVVLVKTQNTKDGGKISVATTKESYGLGKGDILLTKTDAQGNEEWFKSFGGTSYDKASSVLITQDGGYLIVGSTSSFGKGNYDIWVIKTNAKGKEQWNKTFGDTLNDYGYSISKVSADGYLIRGTQQVCRGEELGGCTTNDWEFVIDADGNLAE